MKTLRGPEVRKQRLIDAFFSVRLQTVEVEVDLRAERGYLYIIFSVEIVAAIIVVVRVNQCIAFVFTQFVSEVFPRVKRPPMVVHNPHRWAHLSRKFAWRRIFGVSSISTFIAEL